MEVFLLNYKLLALDYCNSIPSNYYLLFNLLKHKPIINLFPYLKYEIIAYNKIVTNQGYMILKTNHQKQECIGYIKIYKLKNDIMKIQYEFLTKFKNIKNEKRFIYEFTNYFCLAYPNIKTINIYNKNGEKKTSLLDNNYQKINDTKYLINNPYYIHKNALKFIEENYYTLEGEI